MSIRPEWVVKILDCYKTIEIRKTAPKCNLPIDVYIYCTDSKDYLLDKKGYYSPLLQYFLWDKHDRRYPLKRAPKDLAYLYQMKVIAKFTLRKVEEIEDSVDISLDGDGDCEFQTESLAPWELREESCLSERKLEDYIGEGKAYAWYISDLVIFDRPKELSEFGVKRAPQSWQYVEVEVPKTSI